MPLFVKWEKCDCVRGKGKENLQDVPGRSVFQRVDVEIKCMDLMPLKLCVTCGFLGSLFVLKGYSSRVC